MKPSHPHTIRRAAVKTVFHSVFYGVLALAFVITLTLTLLYWVQHNPIWQFWASSALVILLIILQEVNAWFVYVRDFSRLVGIYRCYSYMYDAIVADTTLSEVEKWSQLDELGKCDIDAIKENGSVARVEHVEKNVLRFIVTDRNVNVWQGDAIMESKNVGVMTFCYARLKDNMTPHKRNGVRRIGVFEDANGGKPIVCLFTELNAPHGNQRFGRELLVRK
jgi:hypothetical protein